MPWSRRWTALARWRAWLLAEWEPEVIRGDRPGGPTERDKVRVALGKRVSEEARKVLRGKDAEAARAALVLLATLRPEEADASGSWPLRPQTGELLRGLSADVLPLLKDKDEAVRSQAARTLGLMNPAPREATAALKELLTSGTDAAQRRAAAEGLDALIRTAGASRSFQEDPFDQENLRGALFEVAGAVPAVAAGLKDEDAGVRAASAAALGRAARATWATGNQIASAFANVLAFSPELVREPEQKKQLAEHGKKEVGQLGSLMTDLAGEAGKLAALASDPDDRTATAALSALEGFAEARAGVAGAFDAVAKLSGDKIDTKSLDSTDKALRDAVPKVAGALAHKDVRVRLGGLYVLETLGAEAAPASGAVAKAMADGDPFVRWGAARAAGKMAPAGADALVETLAPLLKDANRDVRITAAAALRRFGPKAGPAVKALAATVKGDKDADADSQQWAIKALLAVGPAAKADAVPALTAALASPDTEVRAAAARGLVAFGPDRAAVAALRKLLDDPNADVRRAAAEALLSPADK